jgi:tRNA(fMet)-specific endonuclease VapC
MSFMLDTNICIYVMNRTHPKLLARFEAAAGRMSMSSITFAELAYGAEKSARVGENLAALHGFRQIVTVKDFDDVAGSHYGSIRAALAGSGKLIGPLDTLIAAHARSLTLTLVTNNRREFDRVPGLKIESWV